MPQPDPKEIARRLLNLYSAIAPRKKAKCIRLTKAQFNKLAGRTKIETTIFEKIVSALRRDKLNLSRVGAAFVIVDETTVTGWLEADKKSISSAIKHQLLSPEVAWPFAAPFKP